MLPDVFKMKVTPAQLKIVYDYLISHSVEHFPNFPRITNPTPISYIHKSTNYFEVLLQTSNIEFDEDYFYNMCDQPELKFENTPLAKTLSKRRPCVRSNTTPQPT